MRVLHKQRILGRHMYSSLYWNFGLRGPKSYAGLYIGTFKSSSAMASFPSFQA